MTNKNVWVTDGVTLKLYADDILKLELPIPVLTVTPDVLMGQDPATGLPIFCPPPVSTSAAVATVTKVSDTFGQTDNNAIPPDIVVPPDLDRICGAAQAMAVALILATDALIKYLNGFLHRLLTVIEDALQALLKLIIAEGSVLVAEEVVSGGLLDAVTVVGDVVVVAVQALQLFGDYFPILSGAYPPLGNWTGQCATILCTAYLALQESTDGTGATGNYVTPATMLAGTLPTKTIWANNLGAHTSSFAGPWQTAMLTGIVEKMPDWAWEYLAQAGAALPSHVCTTLGCS